MSERNIYDHENEQVTKRPEPPKPFAPKQHFYYVVVQDNTGKIIDITHWNDYDVALMRGMEKAKELEASFSVFDLKGRFINGSMK